MTLKTVNGKCGQGKPSIYEQWQNTDLLVQVKYLFKKLCKKFCFPHKSIDAYNELYEEVV